MPSFETNGADAAPTGGLERTARPRRSADRPASPTEQLIAFHGNGEPPMQVVAAPRSREWMEQRDRWAYRCLPLLIANQAGWMLLNPIRFQATWDGGERAPSVRIEFLADEIPKPSPVVSIFGYGIVTWGIPYLFRTSPGWNLLARGPANATKDGISPLEGVIETDWSVATFTMNWKLTRAGHPVSFEADEPFCMIVPQRRGELESFSPEFRPLASEPDIAEGVARFTASRDEIRRRKFIDQFVDSSAEDNSWEGHYFRGTTPDGRRATEHQTKLNLREFQPREK